MRQRVDARSALSGACRSEILFFCATGRMVPITDVTDPARRLLFGERAISNRLAKNSSAAWRLAAGQRVHMAAKPDGRVCSGLRKIRRDCQVNCAAGLIQPSCATGQLVERWS